MNRKFIIILLVTFLNTVSLTARVVMNQSFRHGVPGNGYHETWFLGSNEQAFLYHQYGVGAVVDDGLFVAIKDGGPYEGYSYFELNHPITGAVDGGPAHLPNNPGDLEISGHRILSNGYNHKAPNGMFAIWRGGVPRLPDATHIPIGSKFFFWISGGGNFQLGASVIETPSKMITVRTQAIPKAEYAMWFEPSVVNERAFTVMRK